MPQKSKLILLAGLALAVLQGQVPCSSAASGWDGLASRLAGEVLADPAAFFFDFQQDLEATLPLPPGKEFGAQVNLFPALIPMTYVNISGKVRLHREGRWAPGVPQLDLIGGGWSMAAAGLARNQARDTVSDASFKGGYLGLVAAASVTPRIRFFGGCKYSRLEASLSLKKPLDLLGNRVSDFDSGIRDTFFLAGLEQAVGVEKWWSIQLNYGVREKIISSKVSWSGKNFELGLNIYPEGVLVIHPVWNFHVYF